MTLLAIDPGVKKCGYALFQDRELIECGSILARSVNDVSVVLGSRDRPDICVIELPQIYPVSKGDPNDLISLAYAVGYYQATVSAETQITVLPRAWKGTVKKEVMGARIESRLTEHERKLVPRLAKYRRHDVIDAVGIGLWYLKRL